MMDRLLESAMYHATNCTRLAVNFPFYQLIGSKEGTISHIFGNKLLTRWNFLASYLSICFFRSKINSFSFLISKKPFCHDAWQYGFENRLTLMVPWTTYINNNKKLQCDYFFFYYGIYQTTWTYLPLPPPSCWTAWWSYSALHCNCIQSTWMAAMSNKSIDTGRRSHQKGEGSILFCEKEGAGNPLMLRGTPWPG